MLLGLRLRGLEFDSLLGGMLQFSGLPFSGSRLIV